MTTEQRLEKLERENRWMRRIGAAVAAVAAVVFLMGQGKDGKLPDLEVRSLTVKDHEGRVRIRLGHREGWPQLLFVDATGRTHITLGETQHGPLLRFRDRYHTRVVLCVDHNGAASLLFTDRRGKCRGGLGVDPHGSPSLEFWDRDEHLRAVLGETERLLEATGKAVECSLTLYDGMGHVTWKAPR
jgi:hypothetical protein